MKKFKLYDIVRYSDGTSALMQITVIKGDWVDGVQFYGGRGTSKITNLEHASEAERKSYIKESINRNTGTFDQLIYDVTKWQAATFPKRTRKGILNHLNEEVGELLESRNEEEVADVFLLLIGYCDYVGIDLLKISREKFTKNTFRTWGSKNDKGYFKHD